jgi:D-alanine transaminase
LSDQPYIVYLNGEYIPLADAKISVMDRGFLYGDGVYEVIPVFADKPLQLKAHLARLQNSLERISLDNPKSDAEWQEIFNELLDKNPGDDRMIYLQVTRGVYDKRDITIKPGYSPTVLVMLIHVPALDIAKVAEGIAAITVDDFRWNACDIKSTSLVANVMLRQQASAAGVQDAILVKNGIVTEGTASNVFVVKDGLVSTPPTGRTLLPGITRDLIIEIARNANITVQERNLNEAELYGADEIWMSSSTREIAPVIMLNGEPVGDGKPGPLWRQVVDDYQAYKAQL